MAQLSSSQEYLAYVDGYKKVMTDLGLLYRQRLIQGIKSDEMLIDFFTFTSALRILVEHDSTLIPDKIADITGVIHACEQIRLKYNINLTI